MVKCTYSVVGSSKIYITLWNIIKNLLNMHLCSHVICLGKTFIVSIKVVSIFHLMLVGYTDGQQTSRFFKAGNYNNILNSFTTRISNTMFDDSWTKLVFKGYFIVHIEVDVGQIEIIKNVTKIKSNDPTCEHRCNILCHSSSGRNYLMAI